MPLFDLYVMIDWSARNTRRAGKPDCIWIAHGRAAAEEPTTVSPRSRSEAQGLVISLLEALMDGDNGERALVCADFGYGYPAGFASILPAHGGMPPWRVVWEYLNQRIQDDLGAAAGRVHSNRSNRFEVANEINSLAATPRCPGPFWCQPSAGTGERIPQQQPTRPFPLTDRQIRALRIADSRAGSDTVFRLFGQGSVGSQMLTGIPRLHGMRFARDLAAHSALWPFETGWAAAGAWPGPDVRVVHAEIYPSVRPPLPDSIKDRGQVRAMWHWARNLDRADLLVEQLARPLGIADGSPDDLLIRSEEGWILGCPPPA